MYGLEKEKPSAFEFDLQVELKKNPARKEALIKTAEERAHALKELLRKHPSTSEAEALAALHQGYTALKRVLHRII